MLSNFFDVQFISLIFLLSLSFSLPISFAVSFSTSGFSST